ncbi:hypothetical protein RQP46_000331 [Phenoliferia psychrophenolica]
MSAIFVARNPTAAFKTIRRDHLRDTEQRSQPPKSVPAPDRAALLAAQEAARREVDATPDGRTRAQWRYANVPRWCSTTPLEKLKQVELGGLKSNERAKGRFLLCRIIAPPYLTTVVEDSTGRVERISIFNLPHGVQQGADLDVLYPLGTVLAIREPLVTLSDSGPESTVILVDSPTDVVLLSSADPLCSSTKWSTSILSLDSLTLDHRSVGGAYFIKKQPRLAEATFTRGLATASEPSEILLLHHNRSAAHLQLENFAQAASDASTTLSLLSSSDLPPDRLATLKGQALLRKARAFDGMRAFSKARTAYLDLLEHSPSSSDALASLHRVEARLAESASGKYDWVDIHRRRGDGERSLDVGNFVGPVRPEVLKGRGGGRGVVAARDIEAGELLLVEKAFATAFPAPSVRGSSDLPRQVRLEVTPSSTGKEADIQPSLMHDLVFNVVKRLVANPSLSSTIYSLHGGDRYPPSCGVPGPSFGAEESVPSASSRSDAIDPERISEIGWSNVYALRKGMAEPDGSTPNPDATSPIALFPFASLFNHACVANAVRATSGDSMFIRSRRSIPAGDEIYISYATAAEAEERARQLAKHIPSGCSCELCEAEEFDHELIVMARTTMAESGPGLMEIVREGSVESWGETYGLIQRQLANAAGTYRPDNPAHLKPALFELHLALAEHLLSYPTQKVPDNVADSVLTALTCVGAVITVSFPPNVIDVVVKEAPYVFADKVIEAMTLSAKAYRDAGRTEETRAWMQAARRMRVLVSGGGDSLFDALGDGRRYN